jgi:hypothetical protein
MGGNNMYKIIIDGADDEVTFTNFNVAVYFCGMEFGYEGDAWDEVKRSGDLYMLEDFLNSDGIFAEVVEF